MGAASTLDALDVAGDQDRLVTDGCVRAIAANVRDTIISIEDLATRVFYKVQQSYRFLLLLFDPGTLCQAL